MMPSTPTNEPIVVGRYVIGSAIASGGMASVHLGRLTAAEHGFARTVAIKRLHPHLARDPEFVSMFLDEARLASRIRHANVVPVLDIVSLETELFLVMEYVEGVGLNFLLRGARKKETAVPIALAVRVIVDLLEGLHAAHEALGDDGQPLGIIHRDVSPQNVLVGADGVGRVLDFGVAKAVGRLHETRSSQVKGKLAYMAPEQLFGVGVTRGVDVYAATIVLWEALSGRRLFQAETEGELVQKVTNAAIEPPSQHRPDIPRALDAVVMKGVARNPAERWQTAAEMAEALEQACPPAPRRAVAQWVRESDEGQLTARAALVTAFERSGSSQRMPVLNTPADAIPIDVMPTAISSPSSPSSPSSTSAASVAGIPLEPQPAPPKKSRAGMIVVLALAALALVGGTLGAVALFAKRAPKTETAAQPQPPPPPASSTHEAPPPIASTPATASASAAPAKSALAQASTTAAKPAPKAAGAAPRPGVAAPKPTTSTPVPLYSRE